MLCGIIHWWLLQSQWPPFLFQMGMVKLLSRSDVMVPEYEPWFYHRNEQFSGDATNIGCCDTFQFFNLSLESFLANGGNSTGTTTLPTSTIAHLKKQNTLPITRIVAGSEMYWSPAKEKIQPLVSATFLISCYLPLLRSVQIINFLSWAMCFYSLQWLLYII